MAMWGLLTSAVSVLATLTFVLTPTSVSNADITIPALPTLPPLASILPLPPAPPLPSITPTPPVVVPTVTPAPVPSPQISLKVIFDTKTETLTRTVVETTTAPAIAGPVKTIYLGIPQPEKTIIKKDAGKQISTKQAAFNLTAAALIGFACIILIYLAGYKSGAFRETVAIKQMLSRPPPS